MSTKDAREPTGNCYEAAFKYVVWESEQDAVLVHAEVIGQGALEGLPLGHAWAEETWDGIDPEGVVFCIDKSNGRDVRLPAGMYYHIAKIPEVPEQAKYRRYSKEEARQMALKTGTFGPWELVVDH